jgi:calcium-dependent protein kinase
MLFTNLTIKKTSINSEYKQGEILGEGAFGCVRVVKHKNTGIVRAMKQIKKSNIIKEEEENMFTEVNILKQIDHPNIIKLHELY